MQLRKSGFQLRLLLLLTLSLSSVFVSTAVAQLDTLRIATYNLLKFPGNNGNDRLDDFEIVLQQMQADILVVQELETQAGLTAILDILNAKQNDFEAAAFSDGPDTDSGLFYNRNKVTFSSQNAIGTSVRDIMEYKLAAFGQVFTIFSTHLKAGSSGSNQSTRLGQATLLRNYMNALPAQTNFMLLGDFNMKAAAEQAFIELTANKADNDGRLFDPINQIGQWFNNAAFIPIHTQSTRTTSFNKGATGGLDDRFDMILVSQALLAQGGVEILPDSYTAFGNDSQHFNLDINSGDNTAVPNNVADALHQASDHLPVFADFIFEDPTSVSETGDIPNAFQLLKNFPNPFNPTTTIRFSLRQADHVNLRVFNLAGQEVAVLADGYKKAGEQSIEFDASGLSSGVYIYKLSAHGLSISKKLLLLK